MKHVTLPMIFMLLAAACHPGDDLYDATGAFEAVETMVPAQATGILTDYSVQEGQRLRAGALVGHVDTTQLYLKKLQLASGIGAILSQTPDHAAQLAALQVQLSRDLKEQDRVTSLRQADAATGRQLDDITAMVAVDKKRIVALESSLDITSLSLKKKTGPITAQIVRLDDELRRCRIVNPVTGTVLANYAEPHEMATTGRPLYKIADLSTLNLRAYVTGDQFARLRLGEQVKVRVDDGRGKYRAYTGVVCWISDQAEFTPKTIQTKDERAELVYAVKIRVVNDSYLKIGMYGEVKF